MATTVSTTQAAGPAPRSRFGALADPRYRRYWFGSLASVGAIQVVTIGQGWLIVENLGGSARDLGALGAATAVPTITVNLFGGIVADRLDKRLILLVTSLIVTGLLVLLAVLDAINVVRIWHVVAIAFAQGLVLGFDGPVRNAFFPALIERDQMMSAVALNSVMWQFSRVVTPLIGGPVIALFGTSVLFFVGAGGFAVMFLLLINLRSARIIPAARRNVIQNLAEGLSYIRQNRLFFVLVPLTYCNMFFGMQYIQLMPLFAQRFDVGAPGLGWLFSALGVGAVAGTIITGRLQGGRHLGRVILTGTFTFGLLVIAFAASPWYWLSLVIIFVAGIFNSMFLISSMTALQMRVPDQLRGRVMGIHTITFSLIPLGGLMGGSVAQLTNERFAVALGGAILATIVALVALTQPLVRNLDGRRP